MNFATDDITALLGSLGETVTLQYGITSVSTTALVQLHDERTDPLATGNARQWYVLTMSDAAASILTPDWSVVIGTTRREVLECIPKGNGLTDVYLGDALGECP